MNKSLVLKNLINKAELVIFDMNGLLVNDEPIQLKAFNLVLQKLDIKISKRQWIDKCAGRRTVEIFAYIFKENGLACTTTEIKKYKAEKNVYYQKLMSKHVKKIQRKRMTLLVYKLFKEKLLAVATSGSAQEVEIILGKRGLNIRKYFKYIICGDQVKKGKPNPEIYLKMAKQAKIKTSDCLVFEDSEAGVKSAFAAGMKVVAYPSEYTKIQNFKKASLVI